jgi:hypothetical protein
MAHVCVRGALDGAKMLERTPKSRCKEYRLFEPHVLQESSEYEIGDVASVTVTCNWLAAIQCLNVASELANGSCETLQCPSASGTRY